jgi:hypothetical protein
VQRRDPGPSPTLTVPKLHPPRTCMSRLARPRLNTAHSSSALFAGRALRPATTGPSSTSSTTCDGRGPAGGAARMGRRPQPAAEAPIRAPPGRTAARVTGQNGASRERAPAARRPRRRPLTEGLAPPRRRAPRKTPRRKSQSPWRWARGGAWRRRRLRAGAPRGRGRARRGAARRARALAHRTAGRRSRSPRRRARRRGPAPPAASRDPAAPASGTAAPEFPRAPYACTHAPTSTALPCTSSNSASAARCTRPSPSGPPRASRPRPPSSVAVLPEPGRGCGQAGGRRRRSTAGALARARPTAAGPAASQVAGCGAAAAPHPWRRRGRR